MVYPMASLALAIPVALILATLTGTWLARKGFPLPPEHLRIGCLDGLRGYLALSVLMHHFIVWMQATRLGGDWAAPTVTLFSEMGNGGVALFFMVTGVVFYPKILTGWRDTSWARHFITRAARILPLIMVSILLITCLIAFRTGNLPDRHYPGAALQWLTSQAEPPLLHDPDSGRINAYVLWSLKFEWDFYIFVLPICAFAMDRLRGRLPSWVLPLGYLVVMLLWHGVQPNSTKLHYLPIFVVGMVAFEVRRREAWRRWLAGPAAGWLAVFCLAAGLLGVQQPFGIAQLVPLGFFLMCVACGNSLGGVLQSKGALVLGECSYGIYLLHGIALDILFVEGDRLNHLLTTPLLPILLPVTAMIVVLVASLSFIGLERPALRAGQAFAKRWSARAPAPAVR